MNTEPSKVHALAAAAAQANSAGRMVYVQYAGPLAETFARLREDGPEFYGNQRYLLDSVVTVASQFGQARLLSCTGTATPPQQLVGSIDAQCLGVDPYQDPAALIDAVESFGATDLIVGFPNTGLLSWEPSAKTASGVRKLAMFADSFNGSSLRERWRIRKLVAALNRPDVTMVSNHGNNATNALVRHGVETTKVRAWDYPRSRTVPEATPRTLGAPGDARRVLFVGNVCREKGVDCLLEGVRCSLASGVELDLTVIGEGDLDSYLAMARRLGIEKRVNFAGRVRHPEVMAAMREADVAVVPSLPESAEGMPLTALEALSVRTPIAASDHPMFAGILLDGETAVVHKAGDAASLERSLTRLLTEPDLYRRISANSDRAWAATLVESTWLDVAMEWAGTPRPARTAGGQR